MDEQTKVFNIPDGSNTAELLAMMNGGCGNNMWNNPIWALVFMSVLGRGNFLGNDGSNCKLNEIQNTLNTNQGNTLLMDAIKGNATSIGQLATTLNCDVNAINAGITGVREAIANVANQTGMNREAIINSINNGNTMLANTLQSCCCDIKTDVLKMGYDNQLANLNQTNVLQNAINNNTNEIKGAVKDGNAAIINKLDQIEDARKDREIAALTAQLATVNARAERQAELAPIYQKLNDIQCKQPATVTLPYSCATAVPTNLLYGAFANYGLNPNGSIWS